MSRKNSTKCKQWEKILRHWKESKLSQKRYCEQKGLSVGKFNYWNRKLNSISSKPNKPELIKFPISTSYKHENKFTLQFPNGYQLKFDSLPDESVLAKIIAAVRKSA